MDVWRYKRLVGLGAEVRNSQKHMWHWRDWVVESLNADKATTRCCARCWRPTSCTPTTSTAAGERLPGAAVLQVQPQQLADETVEHTAKAFLADAELRPLPRPQV